MNNLLKKLRSSKGASMILALALVLICVTVASIIVMAASSGASRNLTRTSQQRGYLAARSAAQLIAKELEDVGTLVANQQWHQYDCGAYTEHISDEYGGVWREGYEVTDFEIEGALHPIITDLPHTTSVITVVDGDGAKGMFAELLTTATQHIYTHGTVYTENVKIEPVLTDERLAAVNCTFTMDTGYNLTVEISAEDSDYKITVVMEKDNTHGSGVTTVLETTEHTHMVYYKVLQADGSYTAAELEVIREGQLVSRTQNVSWNAPKIKKGGATE